MFGLTLEKLVVVAIVAGLILGPQRLQEYAHTLARTIRTFRDVVQRERIRAEADLGIPLDKTAWDSIDLRQYDPRRIVRQALDEPAPAAPAEPAEATPTSVAAPGPTPEEMEVLLEAAAHVRPGQKYLVSGSAAHPRRIRIDSLPADDPRRIAAELPRPEYPAETAAVEPITIVPDAEALGDPDAVLLAKPDHRAIAG